MNGFSALLKETQRAPSLLLLCEFIATKWPSLNQEAGSHQTQNLPLARCLDLGLSSLQIYEK